MEAGATDVPQPGLRRSYWLREALAVEEEPKPLPPPGEREQHDVIVIGGGYTGLWTAYFLTERDPGIRVAIVEQDICGGGPSGRNGGFVHGWWDQLHQLERAFGSSGALEVAHAADASVDGIRTFCERHEVDAWFERAGYLRVSASVAQDGDWLPAVAACERLAVAHQYVRLSADEVRARCSSPAFREGAFMPNAATIQPARLARGLRRVLLERGVVIHEGLRARRVVAGSDVAVLTPGPVLRADQVVLAINAWASGWPRIGSALVAWGSYIALTAPAPDALDEMGWRRGEAITDSRFTVHYFRTTPDDRVAFGAGIGPAGRLNGDGRPFEHDRRSVERAVRDMGRLLPALAGVPVEEAWGGPIDVSSDRLPVIGSLHGGRVHFAHGYSGNGVGPAHLAGRVLAAIVASPEDELTRLPLRGRSLRRFPPEPLRTLGARVVRQALIRQDELSDQGKSVGPATQGIATLPRRLGYRLGPELDPSPRSGRHE